MDKNGIQPATDNQQHSIDNTSSRMVLSIFWSSISANIRDKHIRQLFFIQAFQNNFIEISIISLSCIPFDSARFCSPFNSQLLHI